jgi:uncharacterized protein YegP (UPF0339 family)
MLKFEVFRERHGQYSWRLIDEYGHVVAVSGHRYPSPQLATTAARGVQSHIPAAPVEYDKAA